MTDVPTLLCRHYPASTTEFRPGGLSIVDLVSRFGTPVFVYDRSVLDAKFSLLRQSLPPRFEISYSVKANPNATLLRYFLSKGCGLEIASIGEFHQALNAGCRPDNVLFAGPGKTQAELEQTLAQEIGEIHVESALELERISEICRRRQTPARIAIRVNPTEDAQGGAMRMGGKPAPFGVDEECLEPLIDRASSDPFLRLQGIHLFTGTQILDADVLLNQYRKGLEIARRVVLRTGQPLRTVDFGGGLGIPYFAHEEELDMATVREGLTQIMAEIHNDPSFLETRFLVEPGRFLVGEAGVYVARVTDIKISRGKKFVILDGGMNHHLAASGNLGQTIKRNYPIAVLNRLNETSDGVVDVVGPLCTPLDVLGRSVHLPKVVVGDLIGVFQSGAYARSASPLGFLSHPTPPEIWVDRGEASLIRFRGDFKDYFADQPADQPMSAR